MIANRRSAVIFVRTQPRSIPRTPRILTEKCQLKGHWKYAVEQMFICTDRVYKTNTVCPIFVFFETKWRCCCNTIYDVWRKISDIRRPSEASIDQVVWYLDLRHTRWMLVCALCCNVRLNTSNATFWWFCVVLSSKPSMNFSTVQVTQSLYCDRLPDYRKKSCLCEY